MRSFIPILAGVALTVITFDAALASGFAPEPSAEPAEPGIRVDGPERLVCRPVTRTGTRLNLSADCRPREQWTNNNVPAGSMAVRSYRDVEHLSDRLQLITARCGQCWKD